MSFTEKIDWLLNNLYNNTNDSTENNRKLRANILLMLQTLTSGVYGGLTFNKYRGTQVYQGSTSTWERYSKATIIDEVSTSGNNSWTVEMLKESVPNISKFKAHFDSVSHSIDNNVFSGFGSTVRLYSSSSAYTSMSLADFKETYGDYLMFDFNYFSKNITQSINAYLGLYTEDNNRIELTNSVALAYDLLGQNIHISLILPDSDNNSYRDFITGYPNIQYTVNQGGPTTPVTLGTLHSLIDMYTADYLEVDKNSNDVYTLRGNAMIRCTNGSGSYTFYIIKKEVLDSFILDLRVLTNYPIEYSGNIPAPTPTPSGPRITSLTFSDPNAILYPAFDPDFGGPYSLTTNEDSITYTWTKNSEVEKVLINLQEVSEDSYTFSDLGQGSNQGNITVEGEDPDDYFDYEIQINQYSEDQFNPKMTYVSIKDALTTGNYSITPLFDKNAFLYQCDISTETEVIVFKGIFENYNKVKINDVLINTSGLGTSIPVKEEIGGEIVYLANLKIDVINDLSDPEFVTTYNIRLVRQINQTLPYGSTETLSGGVISGSPEVIEFVTNYNPGFYGGSYVPNYRYVRPIYTTANGGNDFEHGYAGRSSGNEEAVQYLNDIINTFTMYGKLDAICEAFIHYSNFINDNSDNNDWRYVLPAINVALLRPSTLTKDHITPKNNKCFIYPYSALEINGYGTSAELVYEEFKKTFSNGKHLLQFDILCKWFAGTSIQVVPVDYQNIEDNFDYAIAGPEMPVFPYTKDQYLNEYHASRNTRSQALEAARQNTTLANIKAVIGGISGVGQGIMGAAYSDRKSGKVGGILSAGMSAINAGLTVYGNELQLNQQKAAFESELADLANRPSSISNQNASPSITMVMKDAACPFIIHKSIRPEFLKKVDKFFTRFGYRTSRTGIPNIYKRENFCYLECKNAVIGGNIPAEDKQALKAIMEHGITFWHYGSTNFAGVGNYKDSDLTYNAAPYR